MRDWQLRPQLSFENKSARRERARRNELAIRLALHSVPLISFEWDIVRDIVRRFDPFDSDDFSSTGMFSRFAAVRDAVHPEDRGKFCTDIEAALRGESEQFQTEIRVLSPDGIVTWYRELGIVERDQLGRPLRMIGVVHDVTAQRDKHALETAPDPVTASSMLPLKALVIDNNRDAADRLALLLGTVGIYVRLACSSSDALLALTEFGPRLVFVDVGIPYIDAVEMMRRTRELPGGRAISLVALSISHVKTASLSERTRLLVMEKAETELFLGGSVLSR